MTEDLNRPPHGYLRIAAERAGIIGPGDGASRTARNTDWMDDLLIAPSRRPRITGRLLPWVAVSLALAALIIGGCLALVIPWP